jgi:hypothetical protein
MKQLCLARQKPAWRMGQGAWGVEQGAWRMVRLLANDSNQVIERRISNKEGRMPKDDFTIVRFDIPCSVFRIF